MKTDVIPTELFPQLRISKDAVESLTVARSSAADSKIGPEDLKPLLLSRFTEPLDFPDVFRSVVPGDTIAISIAPGTTSGMPIALATASLLCEQGASPENIVLVVNDLEEVDEPGPYDVKRFDSRDPEQHAYLVAGIDAEPIYVCRELFDADVVIPIGSFFGALPRDSICPTFCDQQTQEYLLGLRPNEADATINMINENLGVFWQINAVDIPGNELVDVLVGARRSVLIENVEHAETNWSIEIDRQFDLVLVTIESAAEQDWIGAAQAIRLADRVAGTDGAIVLLSRIAQAPPRGWRQTGESPDSDNPLAELFERRHVYLYSRLAPSVAESAGFAPVADSAELDRLLHQYGSATLIRDAHKVDLQPSISGGGAGIL